jgi:ketosteroid isomerase-like protein
MLFGVRAEFFTEFGVGSVSLPERPRRVSSDAYGRESTSCTPSAAQAIRALEAEFVRLARNKEAAALTDMFYAEDAQLLPPGSPLVRGKVAIREFWTAFLRIAGDDVTLESHEIESAGNLAYCIGRYPRHDRRTRVARQVRGRVRQTI